MKRGIVLGVLGVLWVALFTISNEPIISNSVTPPAGKTGAPGEGTCADCHSAGTPQLATAVLVFYDSATNSPVVQYEAGKTYRVVLTATGLATRFGFEMTALDSSANPMGTFSLINPSITAIQTSGGRQYVSHKNANSTSTWEFYWKAPSTSTTSAVFYYAVNFANWDNSTTGDSVLTGTYILPPAGTPPPPPTANPDLYIYASDTQYVCANTNDTVFVELNAIDTPFTNIKLIIEKTVGGTTTTDSIMYLGPISADSTELVPIDFVTLSPSDVVDYLVYIKESSPSQATAGDTVQFTVLPMEPITSASISGPTRLSVGQVGTFEVNVTGSYSFIGWLVQVSGGGTIPLVGPGPHNLSWSSPGTYTIYVGIENPCGSVYLTHTVTVGDSISSVLYPNMPAKSGGCLYNINGSLYKCLSKGEIVQDVEYNKIYLFKREDGAVQKVIFLK